MSSAKLPRWRSRVLTIDDVIPTLTSLPQVSHGTCCLGLSSPELIDGLTSEGIPQLSLDQLNPCCFFHDPPNNLLSTLQLVATVHRSWDGDVLQYLTTAHRLTHSILIKQADWHKWKTSEFPQLDQYKLQGMFGNPVMVENGYAVFNFWTYVVKEVNGHKKARCTCYGSTHGGQVRILGYTYANSLDHTCSRMFYAIATAENLSLYCADALNAFAEAPPPKQGFYIRPDVAFRAWWTEHKQRPLIPPNAIIPVLSAMQGHPEAPRLWEKHADKILRSIGLHPTTHEPCLYSGHIFNTRVLLLRQVDDFCIAAPTQSLTNQIFDLIDDHLTILLKRLGLITLFNGVDNLQTKHYVKILCITYLEQICEKYLDSWMRNHHVPARSI